MRASPWARTTVGRSSAAYCIPMLNDMLTAKRPTMAKDADGIPKQVKEYITLFESKS